MIPNLTVFVCCWGTEVELLTHMKQFQFWFQQDRIFHISLELEERWDRISVFSFYSKICVISQTPRQYICCEGMCVTDSNSSFWWRCLTSWFFLIGVGTGFLLYHYSPQMVTYKLHLNTTVTDALIFDIFSYMLPCIVACWSGVKIWKWATFLPLSAVKQGSNSESVESISISTHTHTYASIHICIYTHMYKMFFHEALKQNFRHLSNLLWSRISGWELTVEIYNVIFFTLSVTSN